MRNRITQLPFLDDYFRSILYSHALPEYERNNALVTLLWRERFCFVKSVQVATCELPLASIYYSISQHENSLKIISDLYKSNDERRRKIIN